MACGSCGGNKIGAARRAPADDIPTPATNDRGMYPLIGDTYGCEAYHGPYTGTSLFLVGYGTEQEKLFFRTQKAAATSYARTNSLSWAHVSVTSLCHERVVGLLGA